MPLPPPSPCHHHCPLHATATALSVVLPTYPRVPNIPLTYPLPLGRGTYPLGVWVWVGSWTPRGLPLSFPNRNQGHCHSSYGAHMGGQVCQLWKGPLRICSQVAAGCHCRCASCCCSVTHHTVRGGLASVIPALAVLSLSRDAYYPCWHCNASKHCRWRAVVPLASTRLCTLVIFTWKPQLRIYVTQLEAVYSKH